MKRLLTLVLLLLLLSLTGCASSPKGRWKCWGYRNWTDWTGRFDKKCLKGVKNRHKATIKKYSLKHPKESQLHISYAVDSLLIVGMSEELAALSIGVPDETTIITTAYGTSKQLVYKKNDDYYKYVYIVNGKVSAFQR
jgi:hypothetical protein